ncbi:hypothetical protein AK812_SmicGene40173 [Symbiodinium microadriaticum]|uniref:Uncharacterized protein n=1 Tax=Symbiodinium microadriaticum TaxID=2951 RepID=A0A1Q9C9J0_SYMMI|nr:hypothetical protein AK812_SmicGene40173 [Symbiodinium microadriaticum]
MFKDAGRTKDEQRFLYMYNTLDTDKDLRKIARAERVAFAAEGRCVNSGETQTLIKPNFVSKKQVEALDCRKAVEESSRKKQRRDSPGPGGLGTVVDVVRMAAFCVTGPIHYASRSFK